MSRVFLLKLNIYSSVGVATRRLGFDSQQGQEIFLYSTASRPALSPTQPHIQWYRVLSAGVKRPGREGDHSPPASAEVKNGGAIPALPHTSSWRNYARGQLYLLPLCKMLLKK
jgi:hypothetical protein